MSKARTVYLTRDEQGALRLHRTAPEWHTIGCLAGVAFHGWTSSGALVIGAPLMIALLGRLLRSGECVTLRCVIGVQIEQPGNGPAPGS